jgi:short-subunit dehydrogenase
LVNNAAIAESGPITEIPMDLLRRMFETNFFAPLKLTQKFVRKFVDEGRRGKIVFTSSIGGVISIPYGGPYAATKHSLEAIAGSMHAELAPFIPKETGLFRNVVPQAAEDLVKRLRHDTWVSTITLPT